jgi:hypothetical protein
MTELTHLLGCELTPVEKSLISFGEGRGQRMERERIIKLLQGIAIETKNGEIAVMELLSAIEALIKGENK